MGAGFSRGRRTVRTTVLAVAIVAFGLIGLLVWGTDRPLYSDALRDQPAGAEGRNLADSMALAELPGVDPEASDVVDLDGVAAMNVLTDEELGLLRQAGPERARAAVAHYDGGTATVLLLRAADRETARLTVAQLAQLQLSYGFHGEPAPRGAAVATLGALPPSDAGARPDAESDDPAPSGPGANPDAEPEPGGRAHYAHDDIVARVEFRGKHAEAVRAAFDGLLADQLEALPADG